MVDLKVLHENIQMMQYGEVFESTDKAIAWIQSKGDQLFPFNNKKGKTVKEVKNVLNGKVLFTFKTVYTFTIPEPSVKWFSASPIDRAKLIYGFKDEIKENAEIIAQFEMVCRGIASKDTRHKSGPLLVDYLQYYSTYCMEFECKFNPRRFIAQITDQTSLSSLGMILGPILAIGYSVHFVAEPKISLLIAFLIHLATKIGIPVDTIILTVKENVDDNTFKNYSNFWNPYILFGDPKKQYPSESNILLNYWSPGVPMIIFEDCDFDSACEIIVDAAFNQYGFQSCSIGTLLIQEEVFRIFVERLKNRLLFVKVGVANDANADIVYPDDEVIEQLTKVVNEAESIGIEVFRFACNKFSPTLLIGGQIPVGDVPVLTVNSFRTVSEAITLANDSKNGLAASIWTENIEVANELILKLKVGNVWVNSYGHFAPDVSYSNYKGYVKHFSGISGFYDFLDAAIHIKCNSKPYEEISSLIKVVKRAQSEWEKITRIERIAKIQLFVNALQGNKTSPNIFTEKVERWSEIIYSLIHKETSKCRTIKKHFVNTFTEAIGVICIASEMSDRLIKFLFACLLEGNAVIFLAEQDYDRNFFLFVQTYLPNNVLKSCYRDKMLCENDKCSCKQGFDAFLNLNSETLDVVDEHESLDLILHKVTKTKSVWFNVGQSIM